MTIASPAPTLTVDGITAPSYADILDYFQVQYRTIYGSDVYLGNDSQDGQFLGVIAKGQHDSNSVAIAVYNAFSPATAQGVGLSSVVKTNGVRRAVATNSTATLNIVGVAGTAVINGIVQDGAKNRWNLPATVNIPLAGTIAVTATCQTAGAVAALPNTINQIITPQLGWQSANNAAAATLGAPVETDAALRQRQAVSVAQPSTTALVGTVGAIAALAGTTRYTGYDNPTGSVDANGLPAHSIAVIVEGGDITQIAQAIANHKTQGCATYGTTTVVASDIYGLPISINFFVLQEVRITAALTISAISGYTADIGTQIKQSLADYINALPIGQKVIWTRLFQPANLNGSAPGLAYEIDSLLIAAFPGSPAAADVAVGFNQAASLSVADITLTLV